MHPRRLDSLLRRILVLSLPVAAAGCGIDREGFAPVACDGEGGPELLGGLTLAPPADYLELRRLEAGQPETSRRVQSAGTPCASASDPDACAAAIAAATSEVGFAAGQCVQLCEQSYLVVNRGQEVSVVASEEALRALLGPIDTPAEALMVVGLEGYHVRCEDEDGGVRAVGGGHEVLATRITSDCDPVETTLYELHVGEDGAVEELESEVLSSDSSCIGRRPAGLRRARAAAASALGLHFAGVAHLEAASVHAFARLRRELLHHGAPRRLVRAAERAMRDEVRHAAVARRLAARFGATAPRPRVERLAVRSLEEVALENAVEGCVRETFGALVGQWQARFARDAAVRAAMGPIARDETRHAELAWAVDTWARSRLPRSARRSLDEARRATLARLEQEARRPTPASLVREAGLPDSRQGAELARRFTEALADA